MTDNQNQLSVSQIFVPGGMPSLNVEKYKKVRQTLTKSYADKT
ncbi:hypothetical protein [Crocosphaera subtropica]|nr:hypothetical protein [Crocosphaera subtropica]